MMINSVTEVGHLTRDAELKYTNSGTALCNFSIAVNEKEKKGDQYVDRANFFDIVLWGKLAEALSPYLKKGKQVAVSGRLRQDRWEKDGAKRSKIKIVAEKLQLLGSKNDAQQTQQAAQAPIDDDEPCPF